MIKPNRTFFTLVLFLISIPSSYALTINAALPITHNVMIRPIIVSDNNGRNTATFFGSDQQQLSIENFVDQIWSQAGIDVNFLAPASWNNTFANWGTGGPTDGTDGRRARPSSDLSSMNESAISSGIVQDIPNIINMFFVNIPAAFTYRPPNTVAGLATINGNEISQFVGTSFLSSTSGHEGISGVVAHEIGHNLGLIHTAQGGDNLMSPEAKTFQLNNSQIATALNSNISVLVAAPVPVPAAVWLLGSALSGLVMIRRRNNKMVYKEAFCST